MKPKSQLTQMHYMLGLVGICSMILAAMGPVMLGVVTSLVCRRAYMSGNLDSESPQCHSPEVETRLSTLYAMSTLVGGVSSLYFTPRLASLSDRLGRVRPLLIIQLVMVMGLSSNLLAYHFWYAIHYYFLLIGSIFEGLATPTLIYTIVSAYVSDCVRPANRPVALSLTFAVTAMGGAVGPMVGYWISDLIGSVVGSYYAFIVIISLATAAVYYLLPESADPDLMSLAAEEYRAQKQANIGPVSRVFSEINLLRPIKDIYTISAETGTNQTNLLVLVVIDTMYVIMGLGTTQVTMLYLQFKFGYTLQDLGMLFSGLSVLQTVLFAAVVPLISYLLDEAGEKALTRGNIWLLRICNLVETAALVMSGLSRTKSQIAIATAIKCLGVIARPSLSSATLNMLPPEKVGRFMGARGVLETVIGMLSATFLMAIYALTVNTSPETVFYVAGAMYAVTTVVSMALRSVSIAGAK